MYHKYSGVLSENEYWLPGKVTSKRYALEGDWQASASKSSITVPRTVKKIPQGCEAWLLSPSSVVQKNVYLVTQ